MIKEFKIIKTKEEDDGILYIYEFKLNEQLFYAHYDIYHLDKEIYIGWWYFLEPELKQGFSQFSDELLKELKKIILNQKDIRLRHLFNPYTVI